MKSRHSYHSDHSTDERRSTHSRRVHRVIHSRVITGLFAAAVVAFAPGVSIAQTPGFVGADATEGGIVRGQPYSADGQTKLNLTLFDGTRIERSVNARFYRDSEGRIRREQTVLGLAMMNPANESEPFVTIVDPVAGVIYTLNPGAQTAHTIPIPPPAASLRPGAGAPPPPPPPPPPAGSAVVGPVPPPPPAAPRKTSEESLGTRQIEGVTAVGRRTRLTIPAGQIGNDRPIDITDERWESPELKLLLQSRHLDPRTGVVEFRLTNLTRTEPPSDLFTVPANYTLVSPPPPPPPPPAPRPRD